MRYILRLIRFHHHEVNFMKNSFPIDLAAFVPMKLDPARPGLSDAERKQLAANIQLCRDAIIFFTAVADARGLGGHTGGPYDIVPEVLIADAFMRGTDHVVPVFYDEAGHRVAIQYLMSVLHGHMEAERLMHYREFDSKLPGHPERGFTPGVAFSSGRLGHLWPFVNGVAMANPDRCVFVFGSDGSQMEGDDAEAARMAVSQQLNVKLAIDDNDVTISGHPSKYLHGYCVQRTLEGHGVDCLPGEGENLDDLYARMAKAVNTSGPVALINHRKMAVGIEGLEGSCHGHDVIKVATALVYLRQHGREEAATVLESITKPKTSVSYRGSNGAQGKNRSLFGKLICDQLAAMTPEQRLASVRAIDSDLEGSCGMNTIREHFPEIYIAGGIMERGNFSACAGFGSEPGRQGIFATFSAFLEMVVSEVTMSRLNEANVLAHFSHAGCDDMADNTCHFGINNFFADNGLPEHDHTRLYFPADQHQLTAMLPKIFHDPGLRFLFSTRSAVPDILREDGSLFFGEGYDFAAGRDEVIREGSAGYVVSYGEMLYRSLDAVEQLREKGLDVGLINKPTLNVIDEDMMSKVGSAPFVLVVESQNVRTGLGMRYGTWLLQRGLHPRYDHIGTHRLGNGGLGEHMFWQGLDPQSILAKIEALAG